MLVLVEWLFFRSFWSKLHESAFVIGATEMNFSDFDPPDLGWPSEAEVAGAFSDPRPPGPLRHEDRFAVRDSQIRSFIQHHGHTTLEENTCTDVCLLTDWSGAATPEFYLRSFRKEVAQCLGIDSSKLGRITLYRASETQEHCRSALLTMKDGPRHVFGSICDRMPPDALSELQVLLEFYTTRWRKRKTQIPCGAPRLRKVRRKVRRKFVKGGQQCAALGQEFMREAWSLLQAAGPPLTKAYCYRCCQECPVNPTKQDNCSYISVVGNTCVPWSSMGAMMGWLHCCSLPFLQYVHELLTGPVDAGIQECTPGFDHDLFAELVAPSIVIEHALLCPSKAGDPARRLRKYVRHHRRGVFEPRVAYNGTSVEQVMQRTLAADAQIFCVAPQTCIDKHMAELAAKKRKISPSTAAAAAQTYMVEDVLSRGHMRRYLQLRSLVPQNTFAIVNTAQSAKFQTRSSVRSGVAPALMCRTSILVGVNFDEGPDRVLVPEELFLVQGWPLFLPKRHRCRAALPVFLRRSKYRKHLRKMAGNGMHITSLFAAYLFLFGGLQRVKDTTATASLPL